MTEGISNDGMVTECIVTEGINVLSLFDGIACGKRG